MRRYRVVRKQTLEQITEESAVGRKNMAGVFKGTQGKKPQHYITVNHGLGTAACSLLVRRFSKLYPGRVCI